MRIFLPLAALWCASLAGQWIDHPAAGIPRLPDGKPNLSAPTPRSADGKPDLSGLWNRSAGQSGTDVTAGHPEAAPQEWVRQLYQRRIDNYAKDNMAVQCLPEGPRYLVRSGYVKMIHTPGLLIMLHEDLTYRQVFLDGRALPPDPNPAWMGYSVGRWDGESLVITTAGFNPRTWLDNTGHAHTEALKITERLTRRDFGHMQIEVTLDDPGAYSKPWTITATATLQPDTDLIEYVCAEDPKGMEHLVGSREADEAREIQVDPAVLASYTGTYELSIDGSKVAIEITLRDGRLMVNRGGRGAQPMIALAPTLFSSSMGTFAFDLTGGEPVLVYRQVESDVRAKRIKR